MKALLLATLLLGTLEAEEPRWKLVSAEAEPPIGSMAQWTFTIRNVSGEVRKIAEDWRTKGYASVNLCMRLGDSGPLMNLFSEPCHGPQSHLAVPPGATITAVIPDLAGFDRDKLLLTLVEGGERTVIGTLSECTVSVAQEPADQPVPKPKADKEAEPAPEPEGSPRK